MAWTEEKRKKASDRMKGNTYAKDGADKLIVPEGKLLDVDVSVVDGQVMIVNNVSYKMATLIFPQRETIGHIQFAKLFTHLSWEAEEGGIIREIIDVDKSKMRKLQDANIDLKVYLDQKSFEEDRNTYRKIGDQLDCIITIEVKKATKVTDKAKDK